jgi:hypothetical protein
VKIKDCFFVFTGSTYYFKLIIDLS